MNLSVAELAELPLAAALVDTEDTVIGHTPEWRGAGPGTVAHPVRRMRLLVATAEVPATCHALLDRLLEAIEQAAGEAAETAALRLRMLAAALRVLAGRRAGAAGSSADVLRFAATGIAARTGLEVVERAGPSFSLRGFEAAALVLVQLAVNAERHEGATAATLSNDRSAFHVSWSGDSAEPRVTAARRRAHRERWGLGFARIAADTLGGAITAPYGSAPGTTTVSFELGLGRLALPLAALRGRRVLKATRAWDEETGTPPGTEAREGTRLALLRTAALRSLRSIVQVDGWTARSGESLVWIAIPPDDITDRAHDVLTGLVHERALLESVPESTRARVTALALLLQAALGQPVPRTPAAAWTRRFNEAAGVFGLAEEAPPFEGVGALDPGVVALVATEAGDGFELDGDQMWLRIRRDHLADAAVSVLIEPDAARIRVG